MKIQQFLEHHGIARNPFAEEDAQTDPVFKERCIDTTYHPTWDKVFGDPSEPATAIVFGEKGSGKTAMRLQIARHLELYNRAHPARRVYVIQLDDFNPFLDRFSDRLSARARRRPERALAQWKLWDHMDAILTLGVTRLVDRMLEVKSSSAAAGWPITLQDIDRLSRHHARDLLLLAACYDQSTAETFKGRWHRLRRRLNFHVWRAHLDVASAATWTVLLLAAASLLAATGRADWLGPWWLWPLLAAAGWLPWLWRFLRRTLLARAVARRVRVGHQDPWSLRQMLMHFTHAELAGQPLPNKDRTDDRYELLLKFQEILHVLNYTGIVVLVDRVDEPYLINGSPELIEALVWPMLDNKFLKQPGLGLKLMLPSELVRFIEREERDFYQRARLDKQNVVWSFQWSGEALFDVANARVAACAAAGAEPNLRNLFDASISDQRLIDAFRSMRVPRHLFKFLYRLLVVHSNAHTDKQPVWQISSQAFEATLAVYQRDQDAMERGTGPG